MMSVASESTKTTCAQVEETQNCRYDCLMTLKQTESKSHGGPFSFSGDTGGGHIGLVPPTF